VLAWLPSVCGKVQMICIWSTWRHCYFIISCFIKIQIALAFLMSTYPGCPGKEDIKLVSVSLSSSWSLGCLRLWLCKRAPLGISGAGFTCPSSHPASSVRSLKRTNSTDHSTAAENILSRCVDWPVREGMSRDPTAKQNKSWIVQNKSS